jgi:hypothetical protein
MTDSGADHGGSWTLGAIRRMNLQLEAHCQAAGCGWFATFNIEQLIANCGADYVLPEHGPGFACQSCGAENLKFRLAYPHREPDP